MSRQSRKLEHIEYFLRTFGERTENGFADITILHDCLSGHALSDICLATNLLDIRLEHPIVIDALTGGDGKVLEVNRALAQAAKACGCALAVGSQYAAIKNPAVRSSYEIVRKENPDGTIFANVGAYASPSEAQEAVDMLSAQALEIHLNIAQELFMAEGDRAFGGYLGNIEKIAALLTVPVIVKETGCGISMEAAVRLLGAGVKIINVAGAGGSNFVAIEAARAKKTLDGDLLGWGINAAVSTLEVAHITDGRAAIIVSGGIRTALDIVKALACGGCAVGIAGLFLKILLEQGVDALCAKIKELLDECKKLLLLAGCRSIGELWRKPLIVTGFARQWIDARGIDPLRGR
jgi:isopentenyl-diphosphate delta-isomerase